MKILFSGASSFTGYWFVKDLVDAGNDVYTTFTCHHINAYDGIRKERVRNTVNISHPIYNCSFGKQKFIKTLKENYFDIYCHHAAQVKDYKSLDYDIIGAVRNNTHNLKQVIEILFANECKAIILTGSIFEQDEGFGNERTAFSPYGVSKGLTYDIFNYYSNISGIKLGKFVIPNPFGPFEEPRFTTYLIKSWFDSKIPQINTPDYVRDNIHISLLSKAYVKFLVKVLKSSSTLTRFNPSGYVESQGNFAKRCATEMGKRLSMPCKVKNNRQNDFLEPLERYNSDKLLPSEYQWNEAQAWDDLCDYYRKYLLP